MPWAVKMRSAFKLSKTTSLRTKGHPSAEGMGTRQSELDLMGSNALPRYQEELLLKKEGEEVSPPTPLEG